MGHIKITLHMYRIKHIIPILGLLLLGWGCNQETDVKVIPYPQSITEEEGYFPIKENTPLYTNLQGEEKSRMAVYLQSLPAPFNGALQEETGAEGGITLKITPTAQGEGDESYTLNISSKGVVIEAGTSAGLFYGLQTLLQWIEPAGQTTGTVRAATIQDSPRFAYRGFMMDVSRHFRSKEFVLKQIDALARYKINRLHLHLTDAAGWRIEIKQYPRLTELGAWRPAERWKDWWQGEGKRQYCEAGTPGAYGGYYPQEDIREIVAYAAERHITVIPEIEMPGHSEEVLAAYPTLACSGKPYTSGEFCIGNEETFTFLENVLTEVMALFPSEYIHIGGDEANRKVWESCPKCRARMEQEGMKETSELQSYLIHRIEGFLNAHGRQLLGWDEIIEGGLAPNATVMSWRGEEGGIKAVRAGQKTVMTPGAYCYLDTYQDAPLTQPEAMGGYLPLEKVYSYDPVPQGLTAEESRLVYGIQGNLWAEYIPGDEQYEYMMYPRILAIAETGWSQPERKDYPGFHARALQAVEWLQEHGYHPFDLKNEAGRRPEALTPVAHKALGKPVVYNAPYNATYAAQGEKTLTDGLRGDWTYSDGAWQGFISSRRMDVVVDLEEVADIHSIEADFIQVTGPEVYLPCEVVISASEDGKAYTELARYTQDVDRNQPVCFKTYGWQGDAKARYIRYEARSGQQYGGWVFTDEIIVK